MFPVTLYSVGADHRLVMVRQIMSQRQGLFDLRDDLHGLLYVKGGYLSIIHEDDPEREDRMEVPSSYYSAWGVAAGKAQPSVALLPDLKGHWIVTTIYGNLPKGKPRVVQGGWEPYHSFQYGGSFGGPNPINVPVGKIIGSTVVLPNQLRGTAQVVLSSVPATFPAATMQGRGVFITFSTDRFFAFSVVPLPGTNPGQDIVYVHDKIKDKWSILKMPTVEPEERIFGDWLATIVRIWRPGNQDHPGFENERHVPFGMRNYPLPPVGYGGDYFLPGTLLLRNLVDGRVITLHTGQEDSEVLDVENDGTLLYRVNDSIFSAQIQGDKLSASTLVVKDQDVPEVHWVFWSASQRSKAPVHYSGFEVGVSRQAAEEQKQQEQCMGPESWRRLSSLCDVWPHGNSDGNRGILEHSLSTSASHRLESPMPFT